MILALDRVCKQYARPGRNAVALEDLSLELYPGEVMGVFGPSGAGKTTMLRIAAGFIAPDSGTVSYKGERMDEMSAAQRRRYLRREVGCVWSGQPWTPGLSVLEHVALPLLIDGCEHRMAFRLARRFLLACEAGRCADAQLEELSDGERQRVAIARALVIEPRLLLADSLLTNLSVVEQEQIMALLASLASDAKVAVLLTDTGAGAMLRANSILYLREGRLVSEPMHETANVYHLPLPASSCFAVDA